MAMIVATLLLANPVERGESVALEIPLNAGYGGTPELAHEVLLVCLTAAGWPIVIDADGIPLYVPPGTLRALMTRAE
jgi:alkylhydroperoxidase/carboxymuconolactone decarboxylase family protein YurZ